MCGRENGKRCTDVNCGVVPTLFGSFFEIPSLHASSFLKCFFVTCFCYFLGGGKGGRSVSLQRYVGANQILELFSDVIFFRAN